MKYGKTLLIAAIALCLHQAANANEAPANALSAEDASLAFGGGEKTLPVAALSAEEMEKTQGAYWPSTYSWMPSTYGRTSEIGTSLIRSVMSAFNSGFSISNSIAALNRAASGSKSFWH